MHADWLKKWAHIKYILYLVLYLVLFIVSERLIVDEYHVSWLPLDDRIPLCEWFVLPYVSWYLFLFIPGFLLLLRSPDGFRRYMQYIGVGFVSAVIFCLLVPNGQELRPEAFERDNPLVRLVERLYAADTNTNVCPSVHVIGSVGVVFAAWFELPRRLKWLRWPALLYAALICLSTVFIKQHSVLDIFVGIPWGCVAGWLVYVRQSGRRTSAST